MTVRTRRVAIDQGGTGNNWNSRGSFISFGDKDYVQFDLGVVGINLGGDGFGQEVHTVTLWNVGLLSLGAVTDQQIAFMNSGQSPIPGGGNSGFPGFFFLFD